MVRNMNRYYYIQAIYLSIIMLALSTPVTATTASQTITSLPDPTRPLGTNIRAIKSNAVKKIRLQSILYSSQRKSIVINGYVKYIGSTIHGRRIIDIKQNSVVISYKGRLQTLHLSTTKSISRRGSKE